MASPPLLRVRELTKEFRSGDRSLTVVRDVTFDLEAGERCAIVGPSGSGKTTLLGLCAGLDHPTRGSIALDGIDLGSLDEDARAALRARQVGFVFQSFRLLPTLTALENVLVPVELRGERWHESAAAELLARVGLADRLHHYPDQLSGGEQQRVALARAFLPRPRLLFADEPTGSLDADTQRDVEELLFDLEATADTTLVLVTHDLRLADRCVRRLTLAEGRVVSDVRTEPT